MDYTQIKQSYLQKIQNRCNLRGFSKETLKRKSYFLPI